MFCYKLAVDIGKKEILTLQFGEYSDLIIFLSGLIRFSDLDYVSTRIYSFEDDPKKVNRNDFS